jgi:flagellar hook-associated protein 3 FlgL
MRVSTLSIYNLANSSMGDANKALVRTQEQISTGKRILTAADDPVAATRIQQLNRNIASIDQFSRNIAVAENNLALEETSLSGATNLLQRMQELAVQAGNTAVLSPSEYASLADEVNIRLEELVGIANTQNSNGDYIFAGFKSDNQPFTGDSTNGYQFNGDEGQLQIKIDNSTTIASNDTAKAIFVDIPSDTNNVATSVNPNNRSNPSISISVGNIVDQEVYDEFYPEDIIIQFNEDANVSPDAKNFTVTERSTGKVIAADQLYTSGEILIYNGVEISITGNPASADIGAGLVGDQLFVDSADTQDVITTLLRFRDALNSYDGSAAGVARLENSVGSTINNLRNAQASISEVVSSIGARNNVLESTRNLHADTNLVSKELLSSLSDLDFAEASTRLQLESFILQAAQASFLRVSELSLINQL